MLQGGEEAEDALWVVLKWEGLAPLILYPSAQQTSGIGLGRLFGGQGGALRERARMLRWVWCPGCVWLARDGHCSLGGLAAGKGVWCWLAHLPAPSRTPPLGILAS